MTTQALDSLTHCRASLYTARSFALDAVPHLSGARKGRANELVEKITDALAHCERLAFIVCGDIRSGDD